MSRIFFPFRPRPLLALASVALLCACQPGAPDAPKPEAPKTVPATTGEDSGAVSSDVRPAPEARADALSGTDWPPMRLTSGTASIACTDANGLPRMPVIDASAKHAVDSDMVRGAAGSAADDDANAELSMAAAPRDASVGDTKTGDAHASDGIATGSPLDDLGFEAVSAAMKPCAGAGGFQVRYAGKISGDFTALVQRTAAMADRLKIDRRVLDIDSTGGRLEDAMPAGDAIAESRWTIRVTRDEVCHSACVLVLAAGDDREIDGKIGIHRMIRVGSKADTRAELSQELREVYGEMKAYLERNGASVAVADLMMTVPNRSLRLLSDAELQAYGLSGANAVQDDLDRIRLARRCGDDFVQRRDAFNRAYSARCQDVDLAEDAVQVCAAQLQDRYGFPDEACPADSPLATLPRPRPRETSEPQASAGSASATSAAATATATAGESAASTTGATAGG